MASSISESRWSSWLRRERVLRVSALTGRESSSATRVLWAGKEREGGGERERERQRERGEKSGRKGREKDIEEEKETDRQIENKESQKDRVRDGEREQKRERASGRVFI